MYPAPTASNGGAVGFGAPGGERVDRRLWRSKGDERVAAVEKIEDQRKPEDFFGYRNRIAPYGCSKQFDKHLFDVISIPWALAHTSVIHYSLFVISS